MRTRNMRSWLFVVSVAYCLCLVPPETTPGPVDDTSTQVPIDAVSTQGSTDAVSTKAPTDVVTTEAPTSTTGIVFIYHLDVTIMNRYGKNVRIIVTRPGRVHQQFVIPVGGSYPIKSTPSTPQQIVITAYDAATFIPIMIDGKSAVFIFPSVTPVSRVYYIPSVPTDAVTTQGSTDATKTRAPTDVVTTESPTSTTGIVVIYHLDVTIVNRFGKNVIILITLPSRAAQRFVIPVGGSYPIISTPSTPYQIVITVYDAATFIPIMIDGKSAVFVSPSVAPVSRVYYIPSEPPAAAVASTQPPTDAVSTEVPTDPVSTQVPTDAVSTQGSSDAVSTLAATDVVTTEAPTSTIGIVIIYHLDVTIVNLYGKNVKIIATRPGRIPQQFDIPVGGSHLIKTTPSTPQQIVITAYDAVTLVPIMIDGKSAVFVFPSVTPVSRVYYIPSEPPTVAVASTQPPTDAVSTQVPTDAVSTQCSTAAAKTQAPTDVVTAESPTSTTGIVIIYHLDVTIVNRYGKDIIILMTLPGRTAQRFVIPVGGSYPIKSTPSTPHQIVITAYDAATFIPIMIDGKIAVFVFPSVTPVSRVYYIPSEPLAAAVASTQPPTDAVSTLIPTDAVSTQGSSDAVSTLAATNVVTTEAPTSTTGIVIIYHLDVTIVNRYGKYVIILVTLPGRAAERFVIPVGGSYPIKSTFSTPQQIVITAYDAATFIPIMIDGKSAVFVFPSVTPVSHVYYISSEPPTAAVASTQPPTYAVSRQVPTDAVSRQGSTDAVITQARVSVTTETPNSISGIRIAGIYYFRGVMKDSKYGREIFIPGRRKYTIENDSFNPVQFRAKNPSGQPVLVINVPFSKFLEQLNEKLRK